MLWGGTAPDLLFTCSRSSLRLVPAKPANGIRYAQALRKLRQPPTDLKVKGRPAWSDKREDILSTNKGNRVTRMDVGRSPRRV